MYKKILNFILVGVLGVFLFPNMISALTDDFNVTINYKGGVSSDSFIIETCKTFSDQDGSCTEWQTAESKTAIALTLNNWDAPENNSGVQYARISRIESDENNYTIIYETATTTEVAGVPINNFIGDVPEDNVDEFIFEFNKNDVVANNTYVISIYPTLKSFGWNFEEETDAGIDNGDATLITDLSDSGNILIEIKDGDYQILPGTDVTIQLLPDEGYQLTSLSIGADDVPLTAGTEVGYYTFEMPNHNLHFRSIFESTEDIIKKNSNSISSATVLKPNGLVERGNLRLSIDDISDATTKEALDEHATNGSVAAYLDLNLDSVIFKGDVDNVWSQPMTDLGDDNVTITLKLDSIDLTDDSYILYEHDGQYHTITGDDIEYNAVENTITFDANQFSNYAVVTSTSKNDYTLANGENNEFIIEFKDLRADADFELEVNTLLMLENLTDEELEAAGVEFTHEQVVALLDGVRNGTSSKGKLMELYELSVILAGNKKTEGPFTFKIKLTNELKKYNTYKMVYVNDDFEVTSTVITGTVKDGYIVFTLPHLSAYALTASNVTNPKTGDGVMNSIIIGSVSLFGLLGTGIYINKKRYN